MTAAITSTDVVSISGAGVRARGDVLAVEEPLEIRLGVDKSVTFPERTISITMRTPGDDLELAVGFLVGEGIVRDRASVAEVKHCGPAAREDGTSNVVKVRLCAGASLDAARLERHFYTTSSCGVCGKTSLEALRTASPPALPDAGPRLDPCRVHAMPAALRGAQEAFDRTGGLHAAALFDEAGQLVCVREDVGRHNAVDKLVGGRLLAGALPLSRHVLLVSGRASFELAQKALMAGIPILAAVGAPSSLAVDLARAHGMTVLGFVRDGRFNAYANAWRVGA